MPQHNSNIAPQHMFDSVTLGDQSLNPSTGLPSLQMRQPSPTSSSSAVDRNLEAPQTYEGLLAANTSLKTRVRELDLINELFRGRVAELEQSDATARRSEMIVRDSEARLRRSLDESQQREEDLKQRLSGLETQLAEGTGHSADSNGDSLANTARPSDVPAKHFGSPTRSPRSA
jgi:GATA-binding protein